jgi:hypothetical protein
VPTRTAAQQQEIALHRPAVPAPEQVQAQWAQRTETDRDELASWSWVGTDAARVGLLASVDAWEWIALVWPGDPAQRGRVPLAWAIARNRDWYMAARGTKTPTWTKDPRESLLFANRDTARQEAAKEDEVVPMYGWWHDPPAALFAIDPIEIEDAKSGKPRLPLWSITRDALGYSPRDQGLPVAITEQNILGVWEWDAGLFLTDTVSLDNDQDTATRILRLDAVLRAFGYRTVLRVAIEPTRLVSLH